MPEHFLPHARSTNSPIVSSSANCAASFASYVEPGRDHLQAILLHRILAQNIADVIEVAI